MVSLVLYIEPRGAGILRTRIAGVDLIKRSLKEWDKVVTDNRVLLVPSRFRAEFERVVSKQTDFRPMIIFYEGDDMFGAFRRALRHLPRDGVVVVSDMRVLPRVSLWRQLSGTISDDEIRCIIGKGEKHLPVFAVHVRTFGKFLDGVGTATAVMDSLLFKLRQIPLSSQDLVYVESPSCVRDAENFLLETIRKDASGPVARVLNKRISLPASLWLAKHGVGPNFITVVNVFLGVSSGVFVSFGGYWYMLLGAFVFQLASIIDGCDGEVAKLLYKSSRFGQVFDTISDNLALLSFFVGLIFGTSRVYSAIWPLYLAIAALGGMGVLFGLIIFFLKKYTNSASLNAFDKEYVQRLRAAGGGPLVSFVEYAKYFFKKDCFSLLFFLSAVLGILPIWIFATSFGTWLASFILMYLYWSDKFSPSVVSKKYDKKQFKLASVAGKKVCVFDFDGTIVNSMENFAVIAGEVIQDVYGLSFEEGKRRYIETSGIPFFEQLEIMFPGDGRNKDAAARFESRKVRSYFKEAIFGDVRDTLKYLKRKGLATVVSSNNFQDLVVRFVKEVGLEFDLVLGWRKGFAKGKEHFEYIKKMYGVSEEEIIFVGDSLKDAERAYSNGVSFIGKEGLFNREEFNVLYPGTPVINSLEALKSFL